MISSEALLAAIRDGVKLPATGTAHGHVRLADGRLLERLVYRKPWPRDRDDRPAWIEKDLDYIQTLVASPNGRALATIHADDRELQIWSLPAGRSISVEEIKDRPPDATTTGQSPGSARGAKSPPADRR